MNDLLLLGRVAADAADLMDAIVDYREFAPRGGLCLPRETIQQLLSEWRADYAPLAEAVKLLDAAAVALGEEGDPWPTADAARDWLARYDVALGDTR